MNTLQMSGSSVRKNAALKCLTVNLNNYIIHTYEYINICLGIYINKYNMKF